MLATFYNWRPRLYESLACLLVLYRTCPIELTLPVISAPSPTPPARCYWMLGVQPRSVDAMTLSAPGHWQSWHRCTTKRPTTSCSACAVAFPASDRPKRPQIIHCLSSVV